MSLPKEGVESQESIVGHDNCVFWVVKTVCCQSQKVVSYELNCDAIIFLRSDAQKGYRTIAYDWKNDKILEISPPLYHLLKKLHSLGQVSEEQLKKLINSFGSEADLLEKAVADLIERGIIIRHEH